MMGLEAYCIVVFWELVVCCCCAPDESGAYRKMAGYGRGWGGVLLNGEKTLIKWGKGVWRGWGEVIVLFL